MNVKVKATAAFYATETGVVSRGQILEVPEEAADRFVENGLCDYVKEPAKQAAEPKKTMKTKKA